MNVKQLLNKYRKIIDSEVEEYDYEFINKMLNEAQENILSYCFIPGCNKKCKNHRGVMIHIGKKHKNLTPQKE